MCFFFFFKAEDGIRDLVRSRGLGDVYKRQVDDGGQDHERDHRRDELADVDAANGNGVEVRVPALSLIHI